MNLISEIDEIDREEIFTQFSQRDSNVNSTQILEEFEMEDIERRSYVKDINAFVHQEMRHKKSKAWDMRLWWLKDKIAQQNFKVFWDKCINNWADYFTKHFSPKYHRILRQRYLQRTNVAITGILQKHFTCPQLRGCVTM